jgi:hypothetical protein
MAETSMKRHAWAMRTVLPLTLPPVPEARVAPAPVVSAACKKKYRKKAIPVAFREQIWIRDCGRVFDSKCRTPWCQNRMTVFDFQSGHNIPESRGGPTKPENLLPLCSRCNQSMGDRYTFDEWAKLAAETTTPPFTVPEVPPPPRRWWWCA